MKHCLRQRQRRFWLGWVGLSRVGSDFFPLSHKVVQFYDGNCRKKRATSKYNCIVATAYKFTHFIRSTAAEILRVIYDVTALSQTFVYGRNGAARAGSVSMGRTGRFSRWVTWGSGQWTFYIMHQDHEQTAAKRRVCVKRFNAHSWVIITPAVFANAVK